MSSGFVLWFTGLSGSGKSTLASMISVELRRRGVHVEALDGDDVRKHLSKGLGFSREDRDANIRRIGFVARLVARSGGCAIAAAISPYRELRNEIRRSTPRFCEVYTECPIEVLSERDPKGLYKRALAGEIKNFTGVDDPYEAPGAPDVHLHTDRETPEQSVDRILARLEALGFIPKASARHSTSANGANEPIAPHGGDLVDRVLSGDLAEEARSRAARLPKIDLTPREAVDCWGIATGAYSPLRGFLGSRDYLKVVREMRLETGVVWGLVTTLSAPEARRSEFAAAKEVALCVKNRAVGILGVSDVFERDLELELANTASDSSSSERGVLGIGGDVVCFDSPFVSQTGGLTARECRSQIADLGHRRVVAWQGAEPPTRGLEYVLRAALEFADALMVNVTSAHDDPHVEAVRRSWDTVLSRYFSPRRTLLSCSWGRTTGDPGRSLLHAAIVAKNAGACRLLVPAGLDGPSRRPEALSAQAMELDIELLPYAPIARDTRLSAPATLHTCPDPSASQVSVEEALECLRQGSDTDAFRPDVAELLRAAFAQRA